MTRFRPTRVEVTPAAITHNVRLLKPERAELMAVVKADGYGHGAVAAARAALEGGATWLAVALVEEGLALREAGLDAPTLVLSEFPPGAEAVALAHRLTPSVYSIDGLARLAGAARGPVGVHVKVDTGMHRVGVWPPGEALGFAREVLAAGLTVEGVWTHFARSEDDEPTTSGQLDTFLEVVEGIRNAGIEPGYLHAANSGAVLRHPESHLDLVRTGIAMYGIAPAPGVGAERALRPCLSWISAVTAVRRLDAGARVSYGHREQLAGDAWVATVPVGYADGYPRHASMRAEALVGGRRCRVVGSVTMDQLMLDCGQAPPEVGDEVVLLGAQGAEVIDAWELATHADTIAYEIVARISARVPRELVG